MTPVLFITLGYWIGVSLCAGVVGGGVWNHWRGRVHDRRLRKQQTEELARFRQEIETRRLCVRALDPTQSAWPGTKTFRVAAVMDECRDHRSFYLVPIDQQPLPAYLPGQYLTLVLSLPGATKPLVRCYSLSDRPGQEFYRITVKRVRAEKPDELPGRGSNYLCEHVAVGSTLAVRAPAGGFFLNPLSRGPVALIASGIGITPILAMLNEIVHEQPGRPVVVFLGMKNGASFPFRQHLRQLAAEHRNVRLAVSYSRPAADEILGRDYDHHGRINLQRIQHVLGSLDFSFYLCGTGGMMAELVPALGTWGVPAENLHFEAFGPSTVKRMQPAVETTRVATTAKVTFFRSQREVATDGSRSLLELAEGEKLPVESGCRAGNCGECVTKILSGKVRTTKKSGVKLAADQCLTCISLPDGDVSVEL